MIPKASISNQQSLHRTTKVLFRWRRLRHLMAHCTEEKIKAQRSHLTNSILPKKCCLNQDFCIQSLPFSTTVLARSMDTLSLLIVHMRGFPTEPQSTNIMPGSWALHTSTHKTGIPGLCILSATPEITGLILAHSLGLS